MILSFLLGAALLIVTTTVHAMSMVGLINGLKLAHAKQWSRESAIARMTVLVTIALAMFLAAMIEAGLWAAAYLAVGAISGLEQAVYFSTVSYTTLGFGDVVLQGPWRQLSAMQAAAGILMFGWTTAFLVAAVHRLYFSADSEEHRP